MALQRSETPHFGVLSLRPEEARELARLSRLRALSLQGREQENAVRLAERLEWYAESSGTPQPSEADQTP